jgi:hypothetical protein
MVHLLPRFYIQAYLGVHHSGGIPVAQEPKNWLCPKFGSVPHFVIEIEDIAS